MYHNTLHRPSSLPQQDTCPYTPPSHSADRNPHLPVPRRYVLPILYGSTARRLTRWLWRRSSCSRSDPWFCRGQQRWSSCGATPQRWSWPAGWRWVGHPANSLEGRNSRKYVPTACLLAHSEVPVWQGVRPERQIQGGKMLLRTQSPRCSVAAVRNEPLAPRAHGTSCGP